VRLLWSPTVSTPLGGAHSALSGRLDGLATSQGVPKPWGMEEPEVYFVHGPVLPTVTVTGAAAVPPGPVQLRV
jgi:hypothetical protein